jgi:hypothetical protein
VRECDDGQVSETIWPGQNVDGHNAAIARVSHAHDQWLAACSCNWAGDAGSRRQAATDREERLKRAVKAAAKSLAAVGRLRPARSGNER